MGQKEKEIINDVIINGAKVGRMFRANCGMGWTGKVVKHIGNRLTLFNPRPFHGMPAGFSDVFGFETMEITSDMVGKKIAVFKAVEIKTGKLTPTDEQRKFLDMVVKNGGIGVIERG